MATVDLTAALAVDVTTGDGWASDLTVAAALPVALVTVAAPYPYLAPSVQDGFIAIPLRGTGTSMVVYRVEPSGELRELRGSPVPLNSGDGIAYDYEPPFDAVVSYVGVSTTDGEWESAEVVLPSEGRDWLRSLTTPERSMPVNVVAFDQKQSEGRVTLYQVLGRRDPIASVDVMTAYTGTMTLYAEGNEVQQIESLLSDGFPLMLHTPPEHGEDRFYFVVTDASWQRVSRLASNPGRTVALSVAEVDASHIVLGVSPSQYDWDDLAAAYTDWDEVVATYNSWRDVLLAGLTLPGG